MIIEPMNIDTSVAVRGRITVTTAGTAVQGTNATNAGGFWLKALPANTGYIYIGETSGNAASDKGFPLSAGDLIFLQVSNLSQLYFDSSVNGEGCAWLKG